MKPEVQQPQPRWWPVLVIGVLSMADGACTLHELKDGSFIEANPLAAWLIAHSPSWFLFLKCWPLVFMGAGVALYGGPRTQRALRASAWLYILLVGYHAWLLSGGLPLLVAG